MRADVVEIVRQIQCGGGLPYTILVSNWSLMTEELYVRLRDAGVDGPFAVALSERLYTDLTESTDGGYPVLQHVHRLIDGPWADRPLVRVCSAHRAGAGPSAVGSERKTSSVLRVASSEPWASRNRGSNWLG